MAWRRSSTVVASPSRTIRSQYSASRRSPDIRSSQSRSFATVLAVTKRSMSRIASENTAGGTAVIGTGAASESPAGSKWTRPVVQRSTSERTPSVSRRATDHGARPATFGHRKPPGGQIADSELAGPRVAASHPMEFSAFPAKTVLQRWCFEPGHTIRGLSGRFGEPETRAVPSSARTQRTHPRSEPSHSCRSIGREPCFRNHWYARSANASGDKGPPTWKKSGSRLSSSGSEI
jgi:hypothetical protein